jgi:hypothetical protein
LGGVGEIVIQAKGWNNTKKHVKQYHGTLGKEKFQATRGAKGHDQTTILKSTLVALASMPSDVDKHVKWC